MALSAVPIAVEAWTAVFGGLIPIAGLVGIAYVIIRAAGDTGEGDGDGE